MSRVGDIFQYFLGLNFVFVIRQIEIRFIFLDEGSRMISSKYFSDVIKLYVLDLRVYNFFSDEILKFFVRHL